MSVTRESLKHRRAFALYTELRSRQKVADALGVTLRTTARWSSRFKWRKRLEVIDTGESDPGPNLDGQDGIAAALDPIVTRPAKKPPRVTPVSPPDTDPEASSESEGNTARSDPKGGGSGTQHGDNLKAAQRDLGLARSLLVTSVRSLLSDPCLKVTGMCEACGAPVVLEGCGRTANFRPGMGDVEKLMRLKAALQDEVERRRRSDDARSLEEVAVSVVTLIEEMGLLDALKARS